VWPSLGSGDRERNVALVQLRREPFVDRLGAFGGASPVGTVGALWGLTAAWRGVFWKAHGPYKSLIQSREPKPSTRPQTQLHVISGGRPSGGGKSLKPPTGWERDLPMARCNECLVGFACSAGDSRSFPFLPASRLSSSL
jgi:hypothetical protein